MLKALATLWILLVIAAGCSTAPQSDRSSWLEPLTAGKWEILSADEAYSVTEVAAPGKAISRALRFELRKGDSWINHEKTTFRAEVATKESLACRAA